jgi:hypothetical protein
MKKLMIAAAAMASVAAFADCGNGGDVPVETTPARVYNIKFTGKSTVAKTGSTTVVEEAGCGNDGSSVTTSQTYRVPGKIVVQGWIIDCAPACDEGLTTAGATYSAFWTTKPTKSNISEPTLAYEYVNVIGKKATQAEIYGTFTGTVDKQEGRALAFTYAGQGKFSKGYYTSFSGNFVGNDAAPIDTTVVPDCPASQVLKCTDLSTFVDENTASFGTWTMKYNSSASKKASKTPISLPSVPSGVTINQ